LMNEHLRPASLPCLAVLLCKPDNVDYCIDKIEGAIPTPDIVRRLSVLRAAHQATIDQERRAQAQRAESSNLRSEQDSEYERTLEADRQRELVEEAERAKREQEFDDAHAQAELDAALAMSKVLDKEACLKRKRERLRAEPPAGADTSKLRLQLPNGSKLDRRFLASATLQEVCDFIDVYLGENEIKIESYSLSTNFPRKNFSDMAQDLKQAGLHPQSVLYIQDLDA